MTSKMERKNVNARNDQEGLYGLIWRPIEQHVNGLWGMLSDEECMKATKDGVERDDTMRAVRDSLRNSLSS